MDRRNFLKSIGLAVFGGVVATLPIKTEEEKVKEEKQEAEQFFKNEVPYTPTALAWPYHIAGIGSSFSAGCSTATSLFTIPLEYARFYQARLRKPTGI